MSAAVAAAIKKLAVVLVSDPKILKKIGGIILGILIIIVMPIGVVLGICTSEIQIDVNRFQEILSENLTEEQREQLVQIDHTMESIDDTVKFAPTTIKQKQLIRKLLNDFPDSKEMLEYEDYLKDQTVGNTSEFITRVLEDNAYEVMNTKTYADYVATRPRAQRFGTHGLFTDDGVQVKLSNVSEELNLHGGYVRTVIVSLRREDAERLGFNDGVRWRDMLRTQTEALATNLKIPMGNLKWFAAFHNESHHPHVHLIAYSVNEQEGYLSKQGINNLRSSFANDIFAQDLLCLYEKQTEHRDTLRMESRTKINEIISKINEGKYDNPKVEELLLKLADRLSKTSGKKVYGYLKADVKAIVDSIVDDQSSELYTGRM